MAHGRLGGGSRFDSRRLHHSSSSASDCPRESWGGHLSRYSWHALAVAEATSGLDRSLSAGAGLELAVTRLASGFAAGAPARSVRQPDRDDQFGVDLHRDPNGAVSEQVARGLRGNSAPSQGRFVGGGESVQVQSVTLGDFDARPLSVGAEPQRDVIWDSTTRSLGRGRRPARSWSCRRRVRSRATVRLSSRS